MRSKILPGKKFRSRETGNVFTVLAETTPDTEKKIKNFRVAVDPGSYTACLSEKDLADCEPVK